MIAICIYSLQSVEKNKTLGPHARQTTALKKNANKNHPKIDVNDPNST